MTSTPETSTINVAKGQTLANGLTLRIGSGGKVGAVFQGAVERVHDRPGPGPDGLLPVTAGRRAVYTAADMTTEGTPGRRARGSSCRRTTRRTTSARCRRRSWPACPGPRCSSSTTARPTAPADSPTSWPPPTRASGSAIGPAKQGLGPGLPRRLRRRPRRRRRARRPDGRRLQPRPGRPARAPRAARGAAGPTSSSARATCAGGGVVDWGIGRRVISRGGSLFARIVLGLPVNDLTGGFKAWRAAHPRGIPFDGVHAGGYVFQIEMTFRADRAGARIAEVPITFRDRRVGQSKMSRRIVVEALVVVVQLRAEELPAAVPPPRDRPTGRHGRCPERLTPVDRPASGSSSTPGRSRTPSAPRSRPPTSGRCSRPSTREPLDGESFAFLLRSDRADPTADLTGLDGHRPTDAAADRAAPGRRPDRRPVLLRGASLGAAWRAERGGAHGAVYHSIGAGMLPIASGLPLVVTLLDLAPWELPDAFRGDRAGALRAAAPATAAARRGRGHRRHRGGGPIRPAPAARAARAAPPRAHRAPARLRRAPAAPPAAAARATGTTPSGSASDRATSSSPARYDARQDLATLFGALDRLAAAGRPGGAARGRRLAAARSSSSARRRTTARRSPGPPPGTTSARPSPTPRRSPTTALAALVRGARATLLPVVAESVGLAAVESIAVGTPVLASAVGALPELVGPAGVLVPAGRPGPAGRGPAAPCGPTSGWSTRPASTATRERAVAAGRGRGTTSPPTTRRVYAEVGVDAG